MLKVRTKEKGLLFPQFLDRVINKRKSLHIRYVNHRQSLKWGHKKRSGFMTQRKELFLFPSDAEDLKEMTLLFHFNCHPIQG